MNSDQKMPNQVWALTGSIGSGKSTVQKRLIQLGAYVIDADEISRELTSQNHPFLKTLAAQLGEEVLDHSKQNLDRAKCRRLMSTDPEFKKKLEGLLHPEIAKVSQKRLRELVGAGKAPVFYSAALLCEAGRHKDFQHVLLVTAPEAARLQWLTLRDQSTVNELKKLMKLQMPDSEKRRHATCEIVNDGSIEDLHRKVDAFFQKIKKSYE